MATKIRQLLAHGGPLVTAILVGGYADPLALWDLRAASTVMQYQVITTGERLWSIGLQAGLFECFVLSEKTALDTARAPLMADIHATGRIHAR